MAELKRLEARLTEGQMAKLDNIARDTGINRTDVLRLLIANAFVDAEGIREGATVVLDTATMAELLRQTRAVGNNLNQATHALNRIAKAVDAPSRDRTAVLDVMEALAGVRYLLAGFEAWVVGFIGTVALPKMVPPNAEDGTAVTMRMAPTV